MPPGHPACVPFGGQPVGVAGSRRRGVPVHLPRSRRVVTAGVVGVVAALGAGAAFGLVGDAGAASGQATTVSHVTGAPTASFNFSVSVSGLTPSAVTITG